MKKAYIEITNICNLNCEFCPGTIRTKSFLSKEKFELILSKLYGKVRNLHFHVMGEPLMHPELGLLLDIAGKYGFNVNITTNGILIGETADDLLQKPALRQINFSLHSIGEGYDLNNYLEKVFSFIKRISVEQGKFISLRLWNLKENESNKSNDNVLIKIAKMFSVKSEDLEKWDDNRGVKIAPNIYLSKANYFKWPSLSSKNYGNIGFCKGLRDQVGILCDGSVVPCCLDSEGIITLGNIFSNSFEEILESSRATSLYNGFSCQKVVEELCQKCEYRQRF